MKKLLSILLSAVLCTSVAATDPGAMNLPEIDADNTPGIEVEYGEGEPTGDNEVAPCEEKFPPPGEDI